MKEQLINSNMGCIEMKFEKEGYECVEMINSNMGCIEMKFEKEGYECVEMINSNMGCIEMFLLILLRLLQYR